MALWESAFELSAASRVSGQSHQHLVWTRGKEWFYPLGMSEGPDNYIWQSHEEWLCNVIAKNYPFNSISGCLSFSNGMTLLVCCGFPFCRAACFPAGPLVLPHLRFHIICVFPSVCLLPGPISPSPPSVPTMTPLSRFRSVVL